MIARTKNKGICKSCKNQVHCTLLDPDNFKWDCQEYEPIITFTTTPEEINQPFNSEAASGICVTCDLKPICLFRSPEKVIFNCELYL
jgi:hypothetical protein